MDDIALTGKLQKLTPDEQSAMARLVREEGEAYVLQNWGTLLEQLRYISTL